MGELILGFPLFQILLRLSKLCYPCKKSRVQQQRLLKNMGAHTVVLDLLQIPYEKVAPELVLAMLCDSFNAIPSGC